MSSGFNPPTGMPRDPDVIIREKLVAGVDPSWIRTPFDPAEDITTGTAEDAPRFPHIAVAPGVEGLLYSSSSGYHSAGPSAVTQQRSGTVDVNCWGGSVEDFAGEDIDPQDVRMDLKNAVFEALGPYATGTTYNGQPELRTLAPMGVDPAPDDATPPRYGYRVTVSYTYARVASTGTTDSQ